MIVSSTTPALDQPVQAHAFRSMQSWGAILSVIHRDGEASIELAAYGPHAQMRLGAALMNGVTVDDYAKETHFHNELRACFRDFLINQDVCTTDLANLRSVIKGDLSKDGSLIEYRSHESAMHDLAMLTMAQCNLSRQVLSPTVSEAPLVQPGPESIVRLRNLIKLNNIEKAA